MEKFLKELAIVKNDTLSATPQLAISPIKKKRTKPKKSEPEFEEKKESSGSLSLSSTKLPVINWRAIPMLKPTGQSYQAECIDVKYDPDTKVDPADPKSYQGQAFAMHVPWERSGTSFATIDEAILDQAGHFLGMTEVDGIKRVLEVLQRGAVYGMGIHKDKSGGVGIVDSGGEPYKDVSGQSHEFSKYKIKIGNLGIFCRPANPQKQVVEVEKQRRVLYYFDGIDFRH